MGLKAVPERSRPRVGLVLGAGGVLGAAWMAGALPALQERLPRPLGELDLIVGTSAGSVLAAALRCGISIDELIAHQRGEPVGPLEAAAVDGLTGGPWPPAPRLRLGSARLMLALVLSPHRVHPGVLASAWLPRGRLPDAVVASCSIPGWYQPAVIGGRRYVDGGVRSPTSLGMLARAGVDEVFVLAPMASVVADRPRMPHEVLERQLRALMTMTLLREVRALRAAGIAVTVLTPGPEDLAVMGVNLMDPRRRRQVFETSLTTSAAALAGPAGREAVA